MTPVAVPVMVMPACRWKARTASRVALVERAGQGQPGPALLVEQPLQGEDRLARGTRLATRDASAIQVARSARPVAVRPRAVWKAWTAVDASTHRRRRRPSTA